MSDETPKATAYNEKQVKLIRRAQLQVIIDNARPNPLKLNHRDYMAYARACDEIRCLDEELKGKAS